MSRGVTRAFLAVVAMIRTLLAYSVLMIGLICFSVFSLLTWRRWSLELSGPVLRLIGRVVVKILGIKLTLVNEWPFGKDEPRVIVVNHQSTLDIIWFSAISPNRLGAVGKRELIWIPIFNLGWWAFKLFLIDRSNRESAIKTIQAATRDTIKHRRSVALSPEGTRSATGELLPFKKGPFYLALEGRLPIYPIVMCGAAEAMPKHTFWAHPKPIHVQFLPSISTDDWELERLDEHIESIRDQMLVAYHELRAHAGLHPITPDQPLSQDRP